MLTRLWFNVVVNANSCGSDLTIDVVGWVNIQVNSIAFFVEKVCLKVEVQTQIVGEERSVRKRIPRIESTAKRHFGPSSRNNALRKARSRTTMKLLLLFNEETLI